MGESKKNGTRTSAAPPVTPPSSHAKRAPPSKKTPQAPSSKTTPQAPSSKTTPQAPPSKTTPQAPQETKNTVKMWRAQTGQVGDKVWSRWCTHPVYFYFYRGGSRIRVQNIEG